MRNVYGFFYDKAVPLSDAQTRTGKIYLGNSFMISFDENRYATLSFLNSTALFHNAESAKLEQAIKANLRGLGYGG
jgi:hypothetical protein